MTAVVITYSVRRLRAAEEPVQRAQLASNAVPGRPATGLDRSVGPPLPRSPFGRDLNKRPPTTTAHSPQSILQTARHGSPFRPSRAELPRVSKMYQPPSSVSLSHSHQQQQSRPGIRTGGGGSSTRGVRVLDASMESLDNAPRPSSMTTSTPMVGGGGAGGGGARGGVDRDGENAEDAALDMSGLSDEIDKALAAAEAVRQRSARLNASLQSSLASV